MRTFILEGRIRFFESQALVDVGIWRVALPALKCGLLWSFREACRWATLAVELIMWNEDPDIFDALEEHDFEHEAADDFHDLEHESEVAELEDDGEAFDEYDTYLDYNN